MIDQLKAFFAVNDMIVQFVHGQVFLILGVIMALQWRQRSKLELARALPWLAAFGLLEAVATWGNSFIPVQMALLSPQAIQFLRTLQLLVYLATYMTLLGFGLKLVEPVVSSHVTSYAPLIGFIVLSLPIVALQAQAGADALRNATIEAALRYFVCFPAALLVAFGLRQQAGHLVGPLNIDRIVGVLRIAGFGFVLYALVEGLLVPPLPIPPASLVNSQTVYNAIGLPAGILRAITGAVITFYFLRALEVFRIEADRVAQALEREQSLRNERERISRDLHDGTIQSIFAAGLTLDGVRRSVDEVSLSPGLPVADSELLGNARVELDQVMTALNKTIQGIRSFIYDLRMSSADEDLARGLITIVSEFRNRASLDIRWNVAGNPIYTLRADQRQQVYQIVREALNNIVRHAGATQVIVELSYDGCEASGRAICLRISDNGTGVVPERGQIGHGLRNMRERAQLLGGSLNIKGMAGKGTVVTLEIKDVENQITAG